jgi:hypothetical protein
VKNTLEALKSSSSLSAISSLLSSADGAGAGRDDMRARVAKSMPAGGGQSEQNCESLGIASHQGVMPVKLDKL